MIRLSSITVTTKQLPKMLSFYEILGAHFEVVKVDKGSQFYRANLNGLEFVIGVSVAAEFTLLPRLQLSFNVPCTQSAFEKLSSSGFECILDPSEIQGRLTSIFADPDGNTVEIYS